MGFFYCTQVDKRILIADVTTKKAIMDIIKSLKEILSDIRYPRKLKNMGDYYAEVVAVVNPDGSPIGAYGVNINLATSAGDTEAAKATESGALYVGNALKKFRDEFATGVIDPEIWDTKWTNQGNGFISFGGNAAGSKYLCLNLDPYQGESEIRLTSKDMYSLPVRLGFGWSLSQRIVGQEFAVELIGCTADGVVQENPAVALIPISGTITVAANVATINTAVPHGLKGGDRICLINNTEARLNVGPVVVTPVTAKQFTVPLTLANGTYTAGGSIYWADPLAYAFNGASYIAENTTATNAIAVTRRNGSAMRSTLMTISTTAASRTNTAPYSDAWNAANANEMLLNMEEAMYISRYADSFSSAVGNIRYDQTVPDEGYFYKIRIRFKQLPNFTKITANILTATKTGTTTATFVTDRPHNLVTGQFVQLYGMRDQANFPNQGTAIAVTVIDATTFTAVCGTASTTNTTGGVVVLAQVTTLPGSLNFSVQSIARSSNVLTATLNAAVSGLIAGEYCCLAGMNGAAAAYNGFYKVLRLVASTVELESLGADFASINTGGAMVKMTDARIHNLRLMDYSRHVVEIANARGSLDAAKAVPVQGSVYITTGNVQNIINTLVADVASAAITTSTTTAAITPTMGVSFQVNIPVTAVTGANPTLDIAIECSDDTGTNWVRIYEFPRITATGIYRSPLLLMLGNRLRYVQTVGGTAPSFTRAINRLQSNAMPPLFLQFFDRALVPNTLNSTTATWFTESTDSVNIVIAMGAAATPPTLALQGSMDGIDWFQIGANINPTANSATFVQVSNMQSRFNRMLVTSAGTGATLKYISTQFLGR